MLLDDNCSCARDVIENASVQNVLILQDELNPVTRRIARAIRHNSTCDVYLMLKFSIFCVFLLLQCVSMGDG